MSRPASGFPSSSATPAPSSPPPSESYLSEVDGTAPSLLDGGTEFGWEASRDASGLNLVSWKLDVNARSEDGVEKRGFNVLNHPTKKANPLRSSRKPLPPLAQPPAPLPKPPPPSHYDPYLKAVTPLYETFLASQSSTLQPPLTGDFDTRPPPRSDLPPLTSVPDLFFEKDFNLSQPSTWESLTGGSSSESSHDTLSTHLDTLERHLIHEITLRSTSFFSALSNLQDLHSESASCLSRISALRGSLKEVGSKEAAKGLEIIDKQEELRTLRVTEDGIQQVAELEELLRVTRGLVEHGDWPGGLTCLGDVVRWWDRHGIKEKPPDPPASDSAAPLPSTSSSPTDSPILPLSTLPALTSLPGAMTELTKGISEQLETALSTLMLSVLSDAESDTFDAERFKESIEPMMSGMARCGRIGALEGLWRDVVTTGVRQGSRKHLPLSNPEEDADDHKPLEMRGANLASALKSLDHTHFLRLSREMHTAMLKRLHLAQEMGVCIEDVLQSARQLPTLSLSSSIPDDSAPTSPPSSLDLHDIIASACELANLRASKILSVRSEQHAALQLTSFVEIFKENWDFVVATEALAKRMIVSLRGTASSQARTFLIAYHSQRLTKSAKLVEEEQWSNIDVSDAVQHVVNLLVQSAVTDPGECFIPPREPDQNGANGGSNKVVSVEDKNYFVVKATAESLILLGDYLKIVINLELVVTDVMGRIIEFLKSFNSRTCQVVLGAGAMRSAGLKNITAKHLALASQSLSVIISLIPYIREFIRRHLSQKQAVMLTEFDKLRRDYQEHQNEIHAKLVAIMSDRLSVHVGSLRAIDWEVTPDKDTPRSYAEMLVKETATLHKVLSKYLAASTVEAVMTEVLVAIVKRLTEEYTKIELKSDDAKKRMLQDAALLGSRLASLAETDVQMGSLETVVKEKPIPKKPMGEAVKGMFRKASTSAKDGEKPTVEGPARTSLETTGEEEDSVLATEKIASPRPSMEKAEPNSNSMPVEAAAEPRTASPLPPIPSDPVQAPPPDEPLPHPASMPPLPTSPAPSEPRDLISPPPRTASPFARAPSPAGPTRPFSPTLPTSASFDNIRRPASPVIATSTPQRASSASPAPSPASPVQERRAPRVSLAHRLKGLASRAGSSDAEQSPPTQPASVITSPMAAEMTVTESPIAISGETVDAPMPPPKSSPPVEMPAPTDGHGESANGILPSVNDPDETAPPIPEKVINQSSPPPAAVPGPLQLVEPTTAEDAVAPPPHDKIESSPQLPEQGLPESAAWEERIEQEAAETVSGGVRASSPMHEEAKELATEETTEETTDETSKDKLVDSA